MDNKSILIYMLKKIVKNLVCNETIRCFEARSCFLVLPVTPGYLFRIYCHLLRMRVELITLPHFILSFPMETTFSSVHFSAAMTIRHSVFCKLGFPVPHNRQRNPSQQQRCYHHLHNQTLLLNEYPRQPLHYVCSSDP